MALVYTVPQGHAVLIKRFGKHSRVQKEGIAFRLPFIEKIHTIPEWGGVANKEGYKIELSEQKTDTLPKQCQTSDNVTVQVNASIYWKIIDPKKAVYDVDILPKSIDDIILGSLRSNIGKFKLDKIISNRQELNEVVLADVVSYSSKWGINFTRIEVEEIRYSDETAEAMMQEMTAERKKRAAILDAEGEAQSKLANAKADADSLIIRAKAQAESIRLTADAENDYIAKLKKNVTAEIAAKIIMSQKYIDGMKTISNSSSDKVFIPNNFTGIFDAFSSEGKVKSK